MKHLFIAAAVLLLCGIIAYLAQSLNFLTIIILAGCVWLLFGFVYYQVESFKYLTAHKVLDGQVRLTSEASAGRVVSIFVLGLFLIAILTFVLGLVLVVLFGVFAVGGVFKGSGLFGVLAAVFGHLTFILLAGAVVTALISAPILGHYVNTLRVENAEPLEQIRQRTG